LRSKRATLLENMIEDRTRELRESNEELADIIRKKDKFFSILAHDLRNQIGSTLSAAILLNNEKFKCKKRNVDLVHQELLKTTTQTNGLLEDLLYWGMKQFNKVPSLTYAEINISSLIRGIAETYQVNKNNVSFSDALDDDLKFKTDPHIVKFIIRNIIQNAIKFSYLNGVVELFSGKENGNATVAITDFGTGMTEEVIQSIYNKKPIRKEGEMGEASTGLGLPTALEYLELLGANLQITSEPGKGSTFKIVFN
jgi:signal transduction histidine kinase